MSLPKVGIPKVGIALLAVCASMLLVPVAAIAQSGSTGTTSAAPTTTLKSYKVSGKSRKGNKKFSGKFTINRFATRNGKSYAVGTLTGRLGHRSVKRSDVFVPTKVQHSAVTTAAVCPVLHLVLGPLHLNLLGLVVDLNQVVLNIQAESGPGNLLGNLVCGIANLLNGTGAGTALTSGQTAGLLTIFQQLVNGLGLLRL